MRLEVHNSADEVVAAFDFTFDEGARPAVNVQSTQGGQTVYVPDNGTVFVKVPSSDIASGSKKAKAEETAEKTEEPVAASTSTKSK